MQAKAPWGILKETAEDTTFSIYAIDNLIDNRPIRYAVGSGITAQEEEIFKENENLPIILKRNDYSLQLLQRVRDESHRFAITFQRNLRTKKTLTSSLEDIPLISKKKSIDLMKHFKSIEKIKNATLVELMQVDGIGSKLAANIYDHFHEDDN